MPALPSPTPSPNGPESITSVEEDRATVTAGFAPKSAYLPIEDDIQTDPGNPSSYVRTNSHTTIADICKREQPPPSVYQAPTSAYLPVVPDGGSTRPDAPATVFLPIVPAATATGSVAPVGEANNGDIGIVGTGEELDADGGRSTMGIGPATFYATPTLAADYRTGTANGVSFSAGPSSAVIDGKTFELAVPTTATVTGGKIVVVGPSGVVSIQDGLDDDPPSQTKNSVTAQEYIIGAFLPTILAILFAIPWQILFAAIQDIEPFYQLTDPRGAQARDSLCLDYRSSVNLVTTVKALLRGHFVVFWAGLCSLVVLALPPLASETVFIGFYGDGRCTATSSRDACQPQLSVYPVAARVLQGILGLVAFLVFCLVITISRRASGVYTNPLSIASVATLFQNQALIDEIRQCDPDGFSSASLETQLQGRRYHLRHFEGPDGVTDYGITRYIEPSFYGTESTDPDLLYRHNNPLNRRKKYASVSVNPVDADQPSHTPPKPQPDYFLHPATITAFALFVLGLLALVVYYNLTSGDTAFERFMDSQTFGVTFMFTAVGVMLNLYWSILDDDLRATHHYRLLLLASPSSLKATAANTILASPPSNPFTGFVYSLQRKAWLPAWLSLVSILTEPLIVALANIPFKPGTAYTAYRVCTYLTIGVLSLMLLGLLGLLVRARVSGIALRRLTEAARDRSVGRVLGLICESSILGDFRGLAELERKPRDEIIKGWEKVYKMGELTSTNRGERWGVDEARFIGGNWY
ncbi:MAG: hypothetical protein Q9169_004668 [Polycauliona sp. 2 TL-2023]